MSICTHRKDPHTHHTNGHIRTPSFQQFILKKKKNKMLSGRSNVTGILSLFLNMTNFKTNFLFMYLLQIWNFRIFFGEKHEF